MSGVFVEDYPIRPLRRSDSAKLLELVQKREELDQAGAEKRLRLMEWTAFNNPFADGEATYYVAEHHDQIVAHLGRMPTRFCIDGQTHKGYFVHDLFVDPACRKKGHGFFISRSLYQMTEEQSQGFCCLIWTSELNLEMQRRKGYYEMSAGRFVKIIDPCEKLEGIVKPAFLRGIARSVSKLALEVADMARLVSFDDSIKIRTIQRFDSRFDELQREIGHKLGISSIKTSALLNWRYVDRPFSKSRIVCAERGGELTGFMVLAPNVKKDYPEGAIVDVVADPDDSASINALIREAVRHFRSERVYSIECILTDRPFVECFRKSVFLKAKRCSPVMLSNLDKTEKRDSLVQKDNWHLCYGESDEFMLRP